MTNSADKATWPHAIGCYFGGAVLTTFMAATLAEICRALADLGLAAYGLQMFGAAVVLVTVFVGGRLPRRARAMFIAGVCTPIAFGVAFCLWLWWAFSHFTF